MKGTNLGEFEELIMLMTAVLFGEAYSVSIQQELEKKWGRSASLSTIHVTLHRLEEKGFLESYFGGATEERGGRRKLLFRVTILGQKALQASKDLRNDLWKAIPKPAFQFKGS